MPIRLALAILAPGLFMLHACATPTPKPVEKGLGSFTSALQYIHREYVDPVESRVLLEQAMQGLLQTSGLSLATIGLPPAVLTIGDEERMSGPEQIPFSSLRAFSQLFSAIKAKDPSLDDMQLFEGAIRGMLLGLDGRSEYFDPEAAKEFGPVPPITAGIGLQITKQRGIYRVVAPLDDSPAARNGLVARGEITAIDGKPLKDVSLTQAVKMLRGKAGTTVVLSITNVDGKKIPGAPVLPNPPRDIQVPWRTRTGA